MSPEDLKVYNSLSIMFRDHAQDSEGALRYALLAVKVEPDWENSHHTLANAMVQLGFLDDAKDCL